MLRFFLRVSLVWLLAAAAAAYNPPVDTAGPLTVRIMEPALGSYGAGGLAELSRPGVPVTINVSLENTGGTPLRGSLRLQVIDRWRVEPAGPVPFTVEAKGRVRLSFTVSFGEGTFTAHYPVHAFAEFEHQGRNLTAHPVLVLATRIPNPPRAASPVEWKPVPVPANGVVGLWRLPIRREWVKLEQQSLPGVVSRESYEATPSFDFSASGVGMNLGPRAPSMRERVVSATVEYPLSLPPGVPVRLRFANQGEAVYRVRVDGVPVFERAVAAGASQAGEADLSRFDGKTVTLQLEAEGSQRAAWIEPLLAAGTPPEPAAFPPTGGGRTLGTVRGYTVRLWPGRRGLLDSSVGFGQGRSQVMFRGLRVRVLDDWLEDWRSPAELLSAREESAAGRYRIRHRFRGWAGTFDLLGELWTEPGALRVKLWLENTPPSRPWFHVYLEEVTTGPWSERARRVYAGPGNVIENPQAFRLGFDGHNMATSYVGLEFPGGIAVLQALDVPPTRLDVDPEAGLYSLNAAHGQTMTLIPAATAWQAARAWRDMTPFTAAAGVPKLAGRFVFDIWGFNAGYAQAAKDLERAFRHGLADAVVIWHNWQRWGYDYRLPDLYPPNPQGGTLEDFRSLVEACRKHGVYFAPHDNYIDYYPDSEGFTYENIAFQRDGRPVRAWFNYGRGAQSYRARGDRTRPFVERNLRLIKEGFAPTAYFIDVWSSIAPYDFWTHEGRFVDRLVTRREWGENFAWIRDFLGAAPQISEAGHDQLTGWLDGAQCNHLRVDAKAAGFAWRIQCADAERIPWIDAVYHDKLILHGAGYQDRYAAGLDLKSHGMYSDDYIATEVLTGHPVMAHTAFSPGVVRKYWLLHDLMRGLAMRRIEDVAFVGGDLHRQHVRWDNGAEVWVNRGAEPWAAAGRTLPRYGHYARVPLQDGAVETAIELRNGAVVEWSQAPAAVFVNARSAGRPISFGALTTAGACRLTREGKTTVLTPLPESGAFEVHIRWSVLPWKGPLPSRIEAVDESGRTIRRVSLATANGEVSLTCEPGVFAYRLL
ncbi:MAG: hypothetical protein IT158_03640 [Bryobacterales bacterium]|nr:hypothetical protein [Bryobacterales bacterium]